MTCGSVAGEPIVLVGAESPEETTTVIPAVTAALSNVLIASALVSGNPFSPKDSLMTLTGSTTVAKLIASRKPDVVVALL